MDPQDDGTARWFEQPWNVILSSFHQSAIVSRSGQYFMNRIPVQKLGHRFPCRFAAGLMHRPRQLAALALWWCALVIASGGVLLPGSASAMAALQTAAAEKVAVRFEVRVPAGSVPAGETVHVAGDHEVFRNWRADGWALQSAGGELWQGTVELPVGTEAEYKFTRGTWETVEKGKAGDELPNRRLVVAASGGTDPLVVAVEVQAWAQPSAGKPGDMPSGRAAPPSTLTGHVEHFPEFPSRHLQLARNIVVWLPPGYYDSTDRYPVLYLQDGQNLFDRSTAAFGTEWNADETATRLIAEGQMAPCILVGVGNSEDRMDEYTPTVDERFAAGGKADAYLKFLIEELKPKIDATYRTRPERESTAIGGSSLGGLVSLYACATAPDVFSRCAALSPTLGWDNEAFLLELERTRPEWLMRTRIWIDMGTAEGGSQAVRDQNAERGRRFQRLLEQLPSEPAEHHFELEADAIHHESAWARRLPAVLKFLFPR